MLLCLPIHQCLVKLTLCNFCQILKSNFVYNFVIYFVCTYIFLIVFKCIHIIQHIKLKKHPSRSHDIIMTSISNNSLRRFNVIVTCCFAWVEFYKLFLNSDATYRSFKVNFIKFIDDKCKIEEKNIHLTILFCDCRCTSDYTELLEDVYTYERVSTLITI